VAREGRIKKVIKNWGKAKIRVLDFHREKGRMHMSGERTEMLEGNMDLAGDWPVRPPEKTIVLLRGGTDAADAGTELQLEGTKFCQKS